MGRSDERPLSAKGGDIWYWICQRCGVYKAQPSRTDLYCSFCKAVGAGDQHTPRGQHGPGCGCLDGQYCCEQRDEWYERHGQSDEAPSRGQSGA